MISLYSIAKIQIPTDKLMVVISPHSTGDFVSWSTKPNLLGDSATSAALGIFVAEVLKPVVPSLMGGDL